MSNRHDRRKASATFRKSMLKSLTLDQHFEETLRRVRAEFERTGEIHPGFECVTEAVIFHVLRIGRTVVQHVQRCATAFVAGELIDTYSAANVGSSKPLACVQPMILIVASPSR